MTELNKVPAFGFESHKWGALGAHKNIAVELLKKAPKNKQIPLDQSAKNHRLYTNIVKIMEMIPIFGIFLGLISLLDFTAKVGRQNLSIHFVERHLIAISGFGFILLPIADIIATIVRNIKAAQDAKKQLTAKT